MSGIGYLPPGLFIIYFNLNIRFVSGGGKNTHISKKPAEFIRGFPVFLCPSSLRLINDS
jgi:hypothetical protein